VLDVPTILVARTDAGGATLLTSDIDPYDQPFVSGERTVEGYYRVRNGIEAAIARALAYAPYADLLWFETAEPGMAEARHFAEAVHAQYPGKLMAYNCSPSFNWKKKLDATSIARFQIELGEMGYKFQFVTLAGFHALNFAMFQLASGYRDRGMSAYAQLQSQEFELEREAGYRAVKHQSFVGTGYFDAVATTVASGTASTLALTGSTEEEQFQTEPNPRRGRQRN
jgi:isocitrate lyase